MTDDKAPVFRVGLAMAGAVSAGAYTAGVLDFLFEALDAWHDAKARGEAVPRHQLALDVASGASAGAMCAALLAAVLPYDFPHVRLDAQRQPSPGASDNPFYRAWVEDIDIRPMLDPADLAGGQLPALLNCGVIDRILYQALDYRAPLKARPYVTRPFVNRYTIGNLRGVPYDLSYRGLRQASDAVYAHDDALGFLVGGAGMPAPAACAGGYARVDERASSSAPDWHNLGEAALASGAFPIFLRPRALRRDAGDYASRRYYNPDPGQDQHEVAVPPAWPDGKAPADYDFVAVDGGIFTNEPLDLAREVLQGAAGHAPQGAAADSAVLMIAPFVGRPGAGSRVPLGPPHRLLLPLLFSFIAQCRFKPADLVLAQDPNVYNRFLVAPTASASPQAAPYWIAGGPLQGFFGFLHREFRKHDFQLGRRNCQNFLRQYFRLPAGNPVVAYGYGHLPPAQRQAWLDPDGQLPIIPLIGGVSADEALCDWPAGVFHPEELMDAIGGRVDAVFRYYRDSLASGSGSGSAAARWATRAYLQLGWLAGRGQVLDGLRDTLDSARKAQQL
ncbi:MAG: patatin-like phospholipase family protein [Nevskia sp.]|nr:patatin-like phospholipase family protein [Nevskia sp.]